MNTFKNNWFTEGATEKYGQVLSVKTDKILHEESSEHQKIAVFESKRLGKVLTLDNFIYCTENTEFPYQEMMAFIPLNTHPEPSKVLVIGCSDGGVVTEVLKHPKVSKVVHCEVDKAVVEVVKRYFPVMAECFKNSRTQLIIGDCHDYMKKNKGKFDVIITDYSDPKKNANLLVKKKYYSLIKEALKPDGLFCSQGESIFFDMKLIKKITFLNKTLFPVVDYAIVYAPAFLGGQVGFFLGSRNPQTKFREPIKDARAINTKGTFKYYSNEMHKASFTVPSFVKKDLEL